MPPSASDDESDSAGVPEMIPARVTSEVDAQPQEDEDDEEIGEDEYHVEKILTHGFSDEGVVLYQIKWLGYEDEADLTWEPVENLEGSRDLLNAYHAKIGGTPQPQTRKRRRSGRANNSGTKRRASEAARDSPVTKKRRSVENGGSTNGIEEDIDVPAKRQLPIGSWEDHVLRVTSVLEETTATNGGQFGKEQKELVGILEWKNAGPKTQHKLKILRQKAPQKLLDYLLSHL